MSHKLDFSKLSLPTDLTEKVYNFIESSQLNWAKIAARVLSISDSFNQGGVVTPWASLEDRVAYMAYFFPLNFLRAKAVLLELKRVKVPLGENWIDFGSGPGTSYFAVSEANLPIKSFVNVEHNAHAIDLQQKLLGQAKSELSFVKQMPSANGQTVIASFALNELSAWPNELLKAETLILIEPSHQLASRNLQTFRKKAIENSFYLWAPCTHQNGCPLLEKSKTDWCHNRIHVELPHWFNELDRYLPMRNNTLTYSYLVASKSEPSHGLDGRKMARMIGDTLFERGKVRQAICRGPEREFASWLTKVIEPTPIPHGALVELPTDFELRGNEIRLQKNLSLWS